MMPIEPAVVDGAWLSVQIGLRGRTLRLRVWRATVGRIKLYLLDSNDLLNSPTDRGITSKLYGGDAEMRLMQELVCSPATRPSPPASIGSTLIFCASILRARTVRRRPWTCR